MRNHPKLSNLTLFFISTLLLNINSYAQPTLMVLLMTQIRRLIIFMVQLILTEVLNLVLLGMGTLITQIEILL